MVKRSEVEELETELRELQVQVPELQETVRQQREELRILGDRTPRPDWPKERRLLPANEQHVVPISRQASKPTAVVATKLVDRLSKYVSQLDVRSSIVAGQPVGTPKCKLSGELMSIYAAQDVNLCSLSAGCCPRKGPLSDDAGA